MFHPVGFGPAANPMAYTSAANDASSVEEKLFQSPKLYQFPTRDVIKGKLHAVSASAFLDKNCYPVILRLAGRPEDPRKFVRVLIQAQYNFVMAGGTWTVGPTLPPLRNYIEALVDDVAFKTEALAWLRKVEGFLDM